MNYPRPVRDVHQLELTTRCNLKCNLTLYHESVLQ